MLKLNYKNFEQNVIETISEYLDANPQYDMFDDGILIHDLLMDANGNIVYAYSWKTKYHVEEGHGFHSIAETSDPKYAILLTREQLKNELQSYAKKCK